MKPFQLITLVFLCLALFWGCEEKSAEPVNNQDQFIRGIFGQERLEYRQGGEDKFFNTYFRSNGSDQLNMIRRSDDGQRGIEIFITGGKLDQQSTPIVIPAQANTAHAEVQLRDYSRSSAFDANDDRNYVGHSYNNGIRLTITSKQNNFLTGRFEGEITTKTGKRLPVRDGEFRIQLVE